MWALQRLRRILSTPGTCDASSMMSLESSENSVARSTMMSPRGKTLRLVHIHFITLMDKMLCHFNKTLDINHGTLGKLLRNLPEMLLQQYEYEEAAVRGGQQLLHSPFFQVLIALACDLRFDRFDNCHLFHHYFGISERFI
jgi:hypothetical protein